MKGGKHRILVLSLITAAVVAPILACKDADSVTGPLSATPTPTAINLNGQWDGAFYSAIRQCELAHKGWAHAALTQHGSAVEGILDTDPIACGAQGIVVHATLVGNRLEGTIENNSAFGPGSTITGGYWPPGLQIDLLDSRGRVVPGGVLMLYR